MSWIVSPDSWVPTQPQNINKKCDNVSHHVIMSYTIKWKSNPIDFLCPSCEKMRQLSLSSRCKRWCLCWWRWQWSLMCSRSWRTRSHPLLVAGVARAGGVTWKHYNLLTWNPEKLISLLDFKWNIKFYFLHMKSNEAGTTLKHPESFHGNVKNLSKRMKMKIKENVTFTLRI